MGECAICRRYGPDLPTQRHHLIPEHRKESPVVDVCPPCHDTVHATFTNEELIETYHTVADLREADRMQGYLSWIRKTDKIKLNVETSIDLLLRLKAAESDHRIRAVLALRFQPALRGNRRHSGGTLV